jgi:WD40 repeat protein
MVELQSKRLSLQPALDFAFGFDFFISYSHADGQTYPKHLQKRLEQVGFKVFLDVSEYAPGMDLPRETVRQVKKSRKLLVVARRAALASEWVKREIEVALSQGKLPIIININSAIEQTATTSSISKTAIEREWFTLNEHLEGIDGFPSDDAVTALVRGFKSARQETKRIRAFAAATAVLTITTAIAVWQGFAAIKSQRMAVENAKQAEANAQEATKERNTAIDERNAALNGRGRLFAAVVSQYNEKADFGTALSVALAGISEAQKSGSPIPSQLQLGLFVALNELRERVTFQGVATPYYTSAPALSPDGKLLATCAQHALVVWDVRSKIVVGNLPVYLDDAWPCNAAFSPDGKTVVFAEHEKDDSSANPVRIRAFDTTLASTQFDIANNNDALSIAFTPDGKYLVAFEEERTSFLDPSSGQTLWSTPREPSPGSKIWRDEYEMAKPGALSSDSTLMVRVVGARVDIWKIAARKKVISFDNMVPITTVAISPDHARIIAASFDGIARVWDIDSRREVFGLAGHSAGIICVGYSPDGSLILTGSKDGTARLWDARSGTPIATLWGRRSPSAAVISGAKMATSSSPSTLRATSPFGMLLRRRRLPIRPMPTSRPMRTLIVMSGRSLFQSSTNQCQLNRIGLAIWSLRWSTSKAARRSPRLLSIYPNPTT